MTQATCMGPQVELLEQVLSSVGEAYLVGSAVWAPAAADRDYVLQGDPLGAAQLLASSLRLRWFVLDSARKHVRLQLGRRTTVDIAPVAEGGISADLAQRDFTINAMALPLPAKSPLLDPFRGRVDLREGLLRAVSEGSFQLDPLRVLRAIRLAAEHNLVIEAQTRAALSAAMPLLASIPGERIRGELWRAFALKNWAQVAHTLTELGLWKCLGLAQETVPQEALLRTYLVNLRRAEGAPLPSVMPRASLEQGAELAVVVLAGVVLASGTIRSFARQLAARLRMTRKEAALLEAILKAAVELQHLSDADPEQTFRLLSRFGRGAFWAAAALGRADALAAMCRLSPIPPGVMPSGDDLMQRVGRPPGPWIRQAAEELAAALSAGRLSSKEEALAAAVARYGQATHSTGSAEQRAHRCCS